MLLTTSAMRVAQVLASNTPPTFSTDPGAYNIDFQTPLSSGLTALGGILAVVVVATVMIAVARGASRWVRGVFVKA